MKGRTPVNERRKVKTFDVQAMNKCREKGEMVSKWNVRLLSKGYNGSRDAVKTPNEECERALNQKESVLMQSSLWLQNPKDKQMPCWIPDTSFDTTRVHECTNSLRRERHKGKKDIPPCEKCARLCETKWHMTEETESKVILQKPKRWKDFKTYHEESNMGEPTLSSLCQCGFCSRYQCNVLN